MLKIKSVAFRVAQAVLFVVALAISTGATHKW